MTDIVGGFRKVVQDLLVPELKAIQVELKHHGEAIRSLQEETKEFRAEMKDLRIEMNERFAAMSAEMKDLRIEMNERFAAAREETNERFADMKICQREILVRLDVDERVIKLETLVERLLPAKY